MEAVFEKSMLIQSHSSLTTIDLDFIDSYSKDSYVVQDFPDQLGFDFPPFHLPETSTLTSHTLHLIDSIPHPFPLDLSLDPPESGNLQALKPWPDSGHFSISLFYFDPFIFTTHLFRDLEEDTFIKDIQVSNYLHDFPSTVHTFTPG